MGKGTESTRNRGTAWGEAKELHLKPPNRRMQVVVSCWALSLVASLPFIPNNNVFCHRPAASKNYLDLCYYIILSPEASNTQSCRIKQFFLWNWHLLNKSRAGSWPHIFYLQLVWSAFCFSFCSQLCQVWNKLRVFLLLNCPMYWIFMKSFWENIKVRISAILIYFPFFGE